MCDQCDYGQMLSDAGLDGTPNRLHVLEVVGGNNYPLTAAEIYATILRNHPVNRVTIYRILDLLVEKDILESISGAGRAAHYGLAPNEHHEPHPHFYCTKCGRVDCLTSDSLTVDYEQLLRTFPGQINRVEVRVEGICRNCLKQG